MTLHRFFYDNDLTHNLWIDNPGLVKQWQKVLRFRIDDDLVLFNRSREVRLYKIDRMSNTGVHLKLITEMKPQLPSAEVYLVWSLLKGEHNDLVLQKCTELGVSHFVPVISDRTIKSGFSIERAERIILESVEQCERADIPTISEPQDVKEAVNRLKKHAQVLVCMERQDSVTKADQSRPIAIVIGPEGGWSDKEKDFFAEEALDNMQLGQFVLRGETACIAAAAKVLV